MQGKGAATLTLIVQHSLGHRPYWSYSFRRVQQFDSALAVLDRGLVTVTDKETLSAEKLDTLRVAGRAEEAVALGRRLISQSYSGPQIWVKLAQTFQDQGKLPEAIDTLEQGLKSNPNDEDLREKLASIFADNDAPQHAALHYKWLTDQFPKKASYPALLANMYLELEFYDRAMYWYRGNVP